MKKIKFTFNKALLLILIVIFSAVSIVNPVFLSRDYLIGVVLRNAVELGLVALPMTLVIITGGIDLSVGNLMVLSGVLGALASQKAGGFAGIIVTLAVGVLGGLFNGVIIAKVKVPPMITTLASMFLFVGIVRGLTGGDSTYAYKGAEVLGTMTVLGIPIQIFIYILFAVFFWVLLSKSTFGRKLYGIGLSENATRYCGVNVDRTLILVYIIAGIMCAVAGMIMLGRFSCLRYDAGTNFNLKVITIVVLGGTSILGGVGDMKGTIIATLIIGVLNSGLTVMNIPVDAQTVVQGVILLISLIAYELVNRNAAVKKQKLIKAKAVKAE